MSTDQVPNPFPEDIFEAAPEEFDNMTSVVAFDPANSGATFEDVGPPPEHIVNLLREFQAQEARIAAQATTTPAPPYFPDGLVIDWIDATVNVKVQILRRDDKKVYDPVSKTFMDEAAAPNNGLIPLVRETSPLRAAYQVVNVPTPATVFTTGIYRLFYFGNNNEVLDACGFGVNNGCPFINGLVPVNAMPTTQDFVAAVPAPVVPPTPDAIATAVAAKVKPLIPTAADNAIKILSADARKHKAPYSPGLAFNKILGTA